MSGPKQEKHICYQCANIGKRTGLCEPFEQSNAITVECEEFAPNNPTDQEEEEEVG